MKIQCPYCNEKFNAPDNYIFKRVKCIKCGQSFEVKSIDTILKPLDTKSKKRKIMNKETEGIVLIAAITGIVIGLMWYFNFCCFAFLPLWAKVLVTVLAFTGNYANYQRDVIRNKQYKDAIEKKEDI